MLNFIYDIEVYPNVFTCSTICHETGNRWMVEHSDRVNQLADFLQMINWMRQLPACRMVGFNNEAYDYPVIHFILSAGREVTPYEIYQRSSEIINTPFRDRFSNIIWTRDRYVPQLDLYKIHHFDNPAKATSLKMLEFQMHRETIQELPYEPGSILAPHEIDVLKQYNCKDTDDTRAFFVESQAAIRFRDDLTLKTGQDVTNFNDAKIGSQFFIQRLESANAGCCYVRTSAGRKVPKQTSRDRIPVRDIIFPYVQFERPEFRRIHDWFNNLVIGSDTKGIIDDLSATIDGFQYVFGVGGIHGSVSPRVLAADDEYMILDVDVTSYYPSLAISNRVYPDHLGDIFCDIYDELKRERVQHPKGTPENLMLKLALNATYGMSNNRYSPFYDPQYTMTITINGQLSLCMLAEQLIKVPGLQMVQINTDGLTVRMPRVWYDHVRAVCAWWEQTTGLDLEYAEYSRMWIRDVNNYIAEKQGSGKLKLKGAYVHSGRGWHQNTSAMVIQKAVEAHLVRGEDVATFIRLHQDPYDFCLRTALKRGSRLVYGDVVELQRITRYYISTVGAELTKLMPPTAAQLRKNPEAPERRMAIQKGWTVIPCNDMRNFDRRTLNYDYYIEKAYELINPLMGE